MIATLGHLSSDNWAWIYSLEAGQTEVRFWELRFESERLKCPAQRTLMLFIIALMRLDLGPSYGPEKPDCPALARVGPPEVS